MPELLKVYQPSYVSRFECIGPDCEDTCCSGMAVAVDRATYSKYRASADPTLIPLFKTHLTINVVSKSDANYGLIAPTPAGCPFLTPERLCAIQAHMGEDALSRTCAVYPRAMTVIDGIVERSLYTSCPEAARLILLDPAPMRFEVHEIPADRRLVDFPTFSTVNPDLSDKPYSQFHEVRSFVISTMQDRSFQVWERLIIVGMFCEQLHRMPPDAASAGVGQLIQSYRDSAADGRVRSALTGIQDHPAAQLKFVLDALDSRVPAMFPGTRFIDTYFEFTRGVRYTADSSVEQSALEYERVGAAFYRPFIAEHAYILENYMVNYVFKSLFPFGPQKSVYHEPASIMSEFVLLAIHYALIRSLLVGVAGYRAAQFGANDAVTVIQSFSKAVEHNLSFLQAVRLALEEKNLTSMALLAVLIKG